MSLLGQRLRQEREARGLALLQVEIDTRIRANLIQALEDGRLEGLPPEPFLRGLIRCYAEYLRVDPQEMLDLFAADLTPATPATAPRPTLVNRPVPSPYKRPSRPPMEKPAQEPSAEIAQPTPVPVERMAESAQPAAENAAPLPPISTPEPLRALRKRLPLAPPSPRPPNPAIKSYHQEPPPAIPPEFLPPPQLVRTDLPAADQPAEAETRAAKEPEDKSVSTSEMAQAPTLTAPVAPKDSNESSEAAPTKDSSEEKPAAAPKEPKLNFIAQVSDHLAHISTQTKIVAAILLLGLLAAVALLAYPQIQPTYTAISSLIQTPTPTRLLGTPTGTPLPGSLSTVIPTLAATAPPFSAVPAVPTREPTVNSTATIRATSSNPVMTLEIAATAPVTAQVGVDGVLVHNGPVATGAALTWSAAETLYLRVENLPGATVTFNDRKQVPLNFAERNVFERQWNASASGKISSVAPVAPRAASPTRALPALVLTSTPVTTPTTVPSATPSPTRSPSPTVTATNTNTVVPSLTPTVTKTVAPSATPSITPSITPTKEPASPTPKPTLTPFGGQF